MEKMASLGKLSATVAHELNNPLSGVLTYARLVKRDLAGQPLDRAVREELDYYLDLIDKECSRCGTIVHNLLAFARRSGGELKPIDLNEIVQHSLMLVRHHLEMKSIRLRCELLPDDSSMVADGGQLQQALVALLVNAVEAIAAAGGDDAEIAVLLEGDADAVMIEISDTGTGIDPEVIPHIFEPFFSTKGEQHSGVGLGLAVVYGIVHRHGGAIEVDSKVGRGTTFHLRLPRHPPAEGVRASEGSLRVPGSEAQAPGQGAPATDSPPGVHLRGQIPAPSAQSKQAAAVRITNPAPPPRRSLRRGVDSHDRGSIEHPHRR